MKRKILDFFKKYLIWIIGLAIMIIYVYSDAIVDNYKLSFTNVNYYYPPWDSENVAVKGPLLSDVADTLYPQIYKTFYTKDKLSLWNSDISIGTENGFDNILYPLNFVYILPIEYAIMLKSILEFLIAFLAMYFLLREYKICKFSAAIGGLLYCFSSVMVVWHGWQHSDVVAFAPFAFMLVERLIQKIKLKHSLWLGAVIFVMLIAGMPTYAAYYMYLLGAYIVISTIVKYKKDIKSILKVAGLFTLSVVLGVLASLPYTMSLLGSVGSNGYSESRAGTATQILDFSYLRTMLLPFFRKNLTEHINETTIFVGLFVLILLPFTFAAIKEKKNVIFYAIASAIIFVLIFTHYLDGFYGKLPAINTSIKYRILCIFNFTLIVLASINLNHIIENREYYIKHKIWFVLMLIVAGVLAKVAVNEIHTADNIEQFYWTMYKTIAILIGLALILIVYVYRPNKIWLGLITLLVMWDVGGFANNYLPWISKEATIIPKATDTIEYLQDNLDNERMAAVGVWTLFSNTNVYYGFEDVRSHSFINTNEDMKNYIDKIDSTAFSSATRICFLNIENYNLLKYMGVKYITGTEVGIVKCIGDDSNGRTVIGGITGNMTVEQNIQVSENNFAGIDLLFATYGNKLNSDKELTINITDSETEELIVSKQVCLNEIKDNKFYRVHFDEIENSAGKEYVVKIIASKDMDAAITLWKNINSSNNFELIINGEKTEGSLALNEVFASDDYEFSYVGEDGLEVIELNDYSQKFELASQVKIMDEDDILDEMSGEYQSNTAFLTENPNNINLDANELNDSENIQILKYTDDYIKLNYSIDTDRYILINDYYDSNWKAYINGEKVDIQKANYLFRAVYAKKGENMVLELKYEPTTTIVTIYICLITLSGIIIAIVVLEIVDFKRRKCQKSKS